MAERVAQSLWNDLVSQAAVSGTMPAACFPQASGSQITTFVQIDADRSTSHAGRGEPSAFREVGSAVARE